MEIRTNREGNNPMLALDGRLDMVASPQLEKALHASVDGATELFFGFADLTLPQGCARWPQLSKRTKRFD